MIGETDMDGGPFRVPRPTDRRAAARPEPARRQPEEAPAPRVESKAVHPTAAPHHAIKEEKTPSRFKLPIIAIIIVVALCIAGWFAWSKMQGSGTAIDSNKYQAVFFTNGQVYFGKLHAFSDDSLKLTDIYYLQTQSEEKTDSANPQQTSTSQNDVQLIKLGDEIHGPEDEMVISKEQLLFYENLKTDGKVAQSIEKHKSSK